jgi:hypothetical protein
VSLIRNGTGELSLIQNFEWPIVMTVQKRLAALFVGQLRSDAKARANRIGSTEYLRTPDVNIRWQTLIWQRPDVDSAVQTAC